MGVTRRAGRKKDASQQGGGGQGASQSQPMRAVFESTRKKEVGLTDLTLVSKITNEAINDNLKLRFDNAEIYVIGIYTDEKKQSYEGRNRLEAPPHVFAIAESAYRNMQGYHQNQCVIISGESGAGKTEAAKRFMEYIARRSATPDSAEASEGIKDKVLATNPLLESFGNAKTLRNNNSSRFGKYLELQFKEIIVRKQTDAERKAKPGAFVPVGASINNYLLEKSRVVGQTLNERNFHIFYQFTKAIAAGHLTAKYYGDTFKIGGPEDYDYLRKANCMDVAGVDDVAEFDDTLRAMETIKIADFEQENIFRMIATILSIGNVTFQEDDSGNAAIPDANKSKRVADLLNVEQKQLEDALTFRLVETSRGGRRGSAFKVPFNVTQAISVRDALAKAIYFNLFDWIVAKLNILLKAEESFQNTIGILDIYGFEIFERNSFEQLCINYVNEKLQQIFIQLTLKAEQEEYAREQIQWTPIKYFDNKIVCDLIEEKRPPGVFAALNDACATAHADPGAADQTFAQRSAALSSNPHFQPRQGQFVIKHYAGDVNYRIDGMTDKNKDQLLKDVVKLLATSKNQFVTVLFPNQVDQDDKRRPPTAGDKIKSSANDLVATLMKSSPSYIRTIKPNENKSPSEYNAINVLHQIKYLGLQENVRIRRAGFAYRQTFERFFARFFPLSRAISNGVDQRLEWTKEYGDSAWLHGTKVILLETRISKTQYQLGTTKVFIKDPETIFALEDLRDRHYVNLVRRLQRVWRNYRAYRIEAANRIKRCWRRSRGADEYSKLRDYGHQLLQNRKERRRFSLIGLRRYLGDYIGINNKGGYGEHVRKSASLSGNESATFSCRCELLVTKFGRSSKPEPRMLVLTSKAVYIIVVALINKQPTIQAERTIPIGAIKYISTSTLKDDWFSIGVSSAQEADPLINCIFKAEFFTQLSRSIPGSGFNLKIGDSIEYNKKPGKPSFVKTIKDPSVARDDFYKSGTIHTGPGEPANSRSKPTPKPKPKAARPITQGKLIRPGGPGGRPSTYKREPKASRPVPSAPARQQPSTNPVPAASRQIPQPPTAQRRVVPQPIPVANNFSHIRNDSPPPAPSLPPPRVVPLVEQKEKFKVLYPFDGQPTGGLTIQKDMIVELLRKETNGWWEVKLEGQEKQGWVPASYIEPYEEAPVAPPAPPPPPVRVVPPPPKQQTNGLNGNAQAAKPTPPPPPKRPAVNKRKPPAPPTPRDSAVSMGTSNSGSGRATPDTADGGGGKQPGMAADIAKLLAQRSASMQGKRNDDDW
ncbi:uncharacterized protein KY384_008586 [Bacidia gigantensis]|uniref:uncharacterized protein n=1 Tax=Bacidia gigantensis TaxID=2732470 RepID=UPI001D046342|nr:uncharacterized protein KY384_008586 [Bacidia gigantensis]KAG8527156.1 hypothetical protein KY384_008586 [Bacidia gigantensis]